MTDQSTAITQATYRGKPLSDLSDAELARAWAVAVYEYLWRGKGDEARQTALAHRDAIEREYNGRKVSA